MQSTAHLGIAVTHYVALLPVPSLLSIAPHLLTGSRPALAGPSSVSFDQCSRQTEACWQGQPPSPPPGRTSGVAPATHGNGIVLYSMHAHSWHWLHAGCTAQHHEACEHCQNTINSSINAQQSPRVLRLCAVGVACRLLTQHWPAQHLDFGWCSTAATVVALCLHPRPDLWLAPAK